MKGGHSVKPTIVIICNNSGGLYSFRNELISELNRRDNEVIAVTPKDDMIKELRAVGTKLRFVDVDRRGINPLKDMGLFLRYLLILKKEKPSLVITYTIKPNVYGGFACRLLRVPYAVNITGLGTAFEREGLLKELVVMMYRTALKRAKVVFFENSENRKVFLEKGIVPKRKTKVLSGAGVNLEHYKYAEYPSDDSTVRFLFIGRIMKEKGVDELFKAVRMLRKEGVDCTLDVLGGYEENYESLIKKYEAEGWLRYHGYQKDVRPFIAECHCFVLPSWHEGMANTNLECASSGRPVITSNIPGCREAVIDGRSGFLCESRNTESLKDAMRRFSELPPEKKRTMGIAGRKHMEEVFDKKKVVAQTISALKLRKAQKFGE